jgi:hypothetical protein
VCFNRSFTIPALPAIRKGHPAVVAVKSDGHQFCVVNLTGIERIGPEISPVLGVLDVQLNLATVDSHDRDDKAANAN